MNPKKEFTRFAKHYQYLSNIQQKIAKELINEVDKTTKNILDIGCGNGNIYNQIDWNLSSFYGIDISKEMCKLHPKKENIFIKEANFDDIKIYDFYKNKNIDLIVSSSALQWSRNIDNVLNILPSISNNIAFSIFTNNSLNELLNELSLKSFLLDVHHIVNILKKKYKIKTYIKTYKQDFETTKELLSFIKKSGISGGDKRVNISDIKRITRENKIKSASFEVLFIRGSTY